MIINEKNINESIRKIKLFLFDLDGVLLLRKDSSHEELFACMAEFANKLKSKNLSAGIITGRTNDPLTKKLANIDNWEIVTSSFNKVGSVKQLLFKLNLGFDNVLYIGDDMLDIPLLQKVGVAIAPSSARREVKRVVDIIIDVDKNKSILQYVINLIDELKDE